MASVDDGDDPAARQHHGDDTGRDEQRTYSGDKAGPGAGDRQAATATPPPTVISAVLLAVTSTSV